MLFGFLYTAMVTASATTLLSKFRSKENEHNIKIERLNQYMRYRSLPRQLQNKIRSYYEVSFLMLLFIFI